MQSVFVSSVIGGFEQVRAGAREAIENMGFRPVMAETAGAFPLSSKRGLLNLVTSADIYLLILGERYGEIGDSGFSPTEDEFKEAQRLNKPIIVLKHAGEMEETQMEFLKRVAGRWEEGLFYATFSDERDAGMKVVRALTNIRQLDDLGVLLPQAQERAEGLARESGQQGFYGGGRGDARVVFAPVGGRRIIDELALNDEALIERLAVIARSSHVVPQALGISGTLSGQGVELLAGDSRNPEIKISIATDGAVTVTGSVAGTDRNLGSMHIDPDRLQGLLEAGSDFAERAFELLDAHEDVQQLAVAVAVLGASGRVFGGSASSNTMSLGGSHSLPQTVFAPEPPLIVRRVDLAASSWRERVVAAVRRVFADAGAATP